MQATKPYGRLTIGFLCATGLAAGCSDGGGGGDDGGDGTGTGCTRDPALLAERAACALDEDCPCGAACVLGVCAATCVLDGDCAEGERCDDFGRCSVPSAVAFLRPLSANPSPLLTVEPPLLEFLTQDEVQTVRLRAHGHDAGTVRVAAQPGLEVQCAADASFAAECTFDGLAADDPAPGIVRVRLGRDLPASGDDEYAELGVFASDQRVNVGVRLAAPRTPPLDRPTGIYRGFARPVGAGLGSVIGDATFPPELSDFRVPLEMTIYSGSGGTHVVGLVDDLQAVFPDAETLGWLYLEAGTEWHLEVLPYHFLGPAAPGAGDVEVTMEAASDTLAWENESFSAVLRVTYRGATLDEHAPFLLWELALTQVEALPPGAPTPEHRVTGYPRVLSPETEAAAELPIEALARGALPPDLGADPAARAGAAVCTRKGDAARSVLLDQLFEEAPDVDGPAGDLACDDGTGNPTLAQRTFGLLSTSMLTVNEVIATCLDDLAKPGLALAGDDAALLASDGCVDASRVDTALALALAADRDRALGTSSTPQPAASALALRLLQQWLSLGSFLSREAAAVQRINDILSESERVAQSYSVLEAVQGGLDAWDLLFRPRIAVGLPLLPPAVLAEPDYRVRVFPSLTLTPLRTWDQVVGLPVTMLGTLREQLAVLDALINEARSYGIDFAGVEPVLQGFLRRAFVALAFAQGLYDSARTGGEPPWQAEWDVALTAAGKSLRQVQDDLAALRNGRNPLGIEDQDLPLYRIGDEVGALDRFSALSDYLLGVGTETTAVAPSLVARAQTALDTARSAWVDALHRDYGAALEEAERSRRIDAVNRRYGEPISELCGNPDWSSDTVLALWDQIDAKSCFVAPECTLSEAELGSRLTTSDLGYVLCLTAQLRARLGPNVRSGDAAFDDAVDAVAPLLVEGQPFPFAIGGVTAGTVTIRGDGTLGERSLPLAALRTLDIFVPSDVPLGYIEGARSFCQSARQATVALRPAVPPAACLLTDHCPDGYVCAAGACTPDLGLDTDQPGCLRGSLGETALSLRAAARDVEIARSEMAELTQRYDIVMRSCMIARLAHAQMEAAVTQHNQTMHALGAGKLAADIASFVAEAAKEACNIGSEIASAGGLAVSAAAEAAAKSVSAGLQYAMDEAQRQHDALVDSLEHQMTDTICLNDAQMELVGTRTAALRVEQASLELSRLMVQFENLKNDLRGLLAEGHAALEMEQDRRVSPLNMDFWLDENVERYGDYLRQARRAVYLAVLAVEYEYQFSSAERSAVLSATTPAQLQQSIDDLRAYTMTGTVGGASPGNLVTVISLRDNLLQLADRSDYPNTWHQLSEAERFRAMLTSPTHAVYDQDGAYLGQELPFALQPLGTLGIGDSGGIPVLTGTDCAERVWSVNASLLGTDLYRGSDTTMTRVVLRKRNIFASQWCSPADPADPFQVASTRPTRNLFLDPYDFSESLTPSTPVPEHFAGEERSFSDARVSAYFNVARAQLEDEAYFNGDSQELAGRGLYGDYALFFPSETLGIAGGDGLVLGNVEDVLLRFDYVSVARTRP